jgi:hypothetical protein
VVDAWWPRRWMNAAPQRAAVQSRSCPGVSVSSSVGSQRLVGPGPDTAGRQKAARKYGGQLQAVQGAGPAEFVSPVVGAVGAMPWPWWAVAAREARMPACHPRSQRSARVGPAGVLVRRGAPVLLLAAAGTLGASATHNQQLGMPPVPPHARARSAGILSGLAVERWPLRASACSSSRSSLSLAATTCGMT